VLCISRTTFCGDNGVIPLGVMCLSENKESQPFAMVTLTGLVYQELQVVDPME